MMLRIRMVQSIAGPSVLLHSGQEVTLDQATALRYVAAGLAEIVLPEPSGGDNGKPLWELRLSPREYLQRYPTGPNAALAQKLLLEPEDE